MDSASFVQLSAPVTVLRTPTLSLALVIYGIYLNYLAIQSGMNLPSQKALYISIILLVIGLFFWCIAIGLAATLAIFAGGFAP